MTASDRRLERERADLSQLPARGKALSREEALALEGTGWDGDLDALRNDSPPEDA